jgi:hypothetical protein
MTGRKNKMNLLAGRYEKDYKMKVRPILFLKYIAIKFIT